MTEQQAIEVLRKKLAKYHPCDDITKALEMAIVALEKQSGEKEWRL